jgi:hypothetical protein
VSAQSSERAEQATDGEHRTHRLFDVARGVDLEHEFGLAGPGVGDSMDVPARDHESVARSQHSVLASSPEPDHAGQDLKTLVLTEMEMAGDEAAGFEAYLGSQRRAVGVTCGLEEG